MSKRISRRSDGASAPLWLYRTAVIVGGLPWLLWIFFSALTREIGRAFSYAYREVRSEISLFREHWNGGEFE